MTATRAAPLSRGATLRHSAHAAALPDRAQGWSLLHPEARTAAIIETRLQKASPSRTGTETDCIVVAAPCQRERVCCAGLHTALGEAVGAAVYRATREGTKEWDAEGARFRTAERRPVAGDAAFVESRSRNRGSDGLQPVRQCGRAGLQDQSRLDLSDLSAPNRRDRFPPSPANLGESDFLPAPVAQKRR
jgi:hypothetical protein